jgi:hypothetical protein
MQRALGCSVIAQVKNTINPLVYNIVFEFGEAQPGPRMLLLWNVVQRYAWKNDAVPEGKLELDEGRRLAVRMGVKRRLGLPKNETP